MPLDPEQTVAAAMAVRPALIDVFIHERVMCIGCPMARFCSLGYAALSHGKDVAQLGRAAAVPGRRS